MMPLLVQLLSVVALSGFAVVCSFGALCGVLMLLGRDVRCVARGHDFELERIAYPVPLAWRCSRCRASVSVDEVFHGH